MSPLATLARTDLEGLAGALRAGRLAPPFDSAEVGRYVGPRGRSSISGELQRLADAGMGAIQIAVALDLLAAERGRAQGRNDRVDLVWSGPGVAGSGSRATATVVRELFADAKRTVLVVSYVLDQGAERIRGLFGRLAERMDAEPELRVRLLINVSRPYRSRKSEAELLREFVLTFAGELWPGTRLPELFHDPRALSDNYDERACLHAKCVVIDDERALVTSANFTEAAHDRNVEAGVLLDDPRQAKAIRRRFDALIERGVLLAAPLPAE